MATISPILSIAKTHGISRVAALAITTTITKSIKTITV
jgi:hypothetical protein